MLVGLKLQRFSLDTGQPCQVLFPKHIKQVVPSHNLTDSSLCSQTNEPMDVFSTGLELSREKNNLDVSRHCK